MALSYLLGINLLPIIKSISVIQCMSCYIFVFTRGLDWFLKQSFSAFTRRTFGRYPRLDCRRSAGFAWSTGNRKWDTLKKDGIVRGAHGSNGRKLRLYFSYVGKIIVDVSVITLCKFLLIFSRNEMELS